MLCVIDPGTDQSDSVADARCRKVSVVARPQIDDQKTVLLAIVVGRQEALVLDRDVEMQIPVLLVVADQGDPAADAEAGIQNREPFAVINASQRLRGGWTHSGPPADSSLLLVFGVPAATLTRLILDK